MANKHNVRERSINGRRNRTRRGFTLIEVMVAATLNAMALGCTVALMVGGMSSWIRGQAKVDAETSAQTGIRVIASELRGAMQVTVDGNGLGVTYELPSKDPNGNLLSPITWDGVTRRIALQGTSLVKTVGASTRTVVQGVILTYPLSSNGTGTYKVFTPGPGTVTRQVTMELVTQKQGVNSATKYSARNRETIYIRNVPQLLQ